jgi:hypothetical protein
LQSQPDNYITLPLVREEQENICFPLVINVVSQYWGEEIPLTEATEMAKKYPRIRGSIMMEGIDKGSLKDIKKRISQGIPPIVILPGIRETVQHATIVSGYNSEENRILTYIPEPDTMGAIPERKFEQDWDQEDMVTLILIPNDMEDIFKNENLKFKDSNRLCFEAEKLRIQDKTNLAIEKLLKSIMNSI